MKIAQPDSREGLLMFNELTVKIKIYLSNLFCRDIVKDTAWTTFFSILGKGAGFLIPFFIAAWFGVSCETDAFFFAYSLILFLSTIFSPVIERIVVPFVVDAIAKEENVEDFISKILGLSSAGLFVIYLAFYFIIYSILPVISQFSSNSIKLVLQILLESSPLVILLVWTGILSGTLNAYKNFIIPAISPAIRAFITILFILVFKEIIGVHSIAVGYVVGEIFRLFILFFMLHYLNIFHFKIRFVWDKKISVFLRTSSFQFMGMVLLAFAPIINKAIASWLGPGKVSLLEYAERLYSIPISLLSSGFTVTLLSYWSRDFHAEDNGLERATFRTTKIIFILALVLTAVMLLSMDRAVVFVYGSSKLRLDQINVVKKTFGFYLLGVTPYYLSQVYVTAFLSRKKTNVLLMTAGFMILNTILFDIILVPKMDVSGIALAQTIVNILAFIFIYLMFRMDRGQ